MTVRYFADSNVFVCLRLRLRPGCRHQADPGHRLDRPCRRRRRIGGQHLGATRVLQRRDPQAGDAAGPGTAEQAVRELARYPLVTEDGALVLDAIALHRRDRISIWDALIVEAARRAKARVLYTEDLQDGRDFDGVTVENPFREQP